MNPVLVYDGNCSFCRVCVCFGKAITREHIVYAPFQEAANRFRDVPPGAFAEAVHLIGEDGRISRGAEAVFRVLAVVPEMRWMLQVYKSFPGAAALTEWVYRFVSNHRRGLYRLVRFIFRGSPCAGAGA